MTTLDFLEWAAGNGHGTLFTLSTSSVAFWVDYKGKIPLYAQLVFLVSEIHLKQDNQRLKTLAPLTDLINLICPVPNLTHPFLKCIMNTKQAKSRPTLILECTITWEKFNHPPAVLTNFWIRLCINRYLPKLEDCGIVIAMSESAMASKVLLQRVLAEILT